MIKLRWDTRYGLTQITLPTGEELRHDPGYRDGCAKLAGKVLESALEDLTDPMASDEERQNADQFLTANPSGTNDIDAIFAHWWAYFAPFTSLERFRQLVAWAKAHPRPRGGVGATTWTMHAERHQGAWGKQ